MTAQRLAVPAVGSPFVPLGRSPARGNAPPGPPTAAGCLRCQLAGRRRLGCLQADACARLPLFFPLAPLLLAGWVATALAFLLTI